MILSKNILLIVMLCGPLFLQACSPAQLPQRTERIVFPPAPATAKIEYIKSYFSDKDLMYEGPDFWTKHVLGELPPKTIFSSPTDVVSDGEGKVYVTDQGLRQVVVLDLNKQAYRFMSSTGDDSSQVKAYGSAMGLTIDDDGRLYIAKPANATVDVFDSKEHFLFAIKDQELLRPVAVAVDSDHARIYVVDVGNHRLAVYDLSGKLVSYIGSRGAEPGAFNFPVDVDIDDIGNLYVMDALNARVQVFDRQGQFLRMFGERGTMDGSFQLPKNLAVGNSDQVYITDGLAHKVVVFDLEGQLLLRLGGRSVAKDNFIPAGFNLPKGIDVDKNGTIWVADSYNQMVHRFQYLNEQYLSEHPLD